MKNISPLADRKPIVRILAVAGILASSIFAGYLLSRLLLPLFPDGQSHHVERYFESRVHVDGKAHFRDHAASDISRRLERKLRLKKKDLLERVERLKIRINGEEFKIESESSSNGDSYVLLFNGEEWVRIQDGDRRCRKKKRKRRSCGWDNHHGD